MIACDDEKRGDPGPAACRSGKLSTRQTGPVAPRRLTRGRSQPHPYSARGERRTDRRVSLSAKPNKAATIAAVSHAPASSGYASAEIAVMVRTKMERMESSVFMMMVEVAFKNTGSGEKLRGGFGRAANR